MILMSLLLAALSFNPAMPARTVPTEGYIQGALVDGQTTCKPGHICASATTTLHGCFVNNFYNGTQGGSPLTIDVTQTGGSGTKTYIYWINTYYKNIVISGNAQAKYYCP